MPVNVQRYATKCPGCGVSLYYTPTKAKAGFCPFCRKFFLASRHENPKQIESRNMPKCFSCHSRKKKRVGLEPLDGVDYKCPECSLKYTYVKQESVISPMPDLIYPFRVSRKLAAKLMATWLMGNEDVPEDALQEFRPEFIDAVYIPVYVYEGKYKFRYDAFKGDKRIKKGKIAENFRIAQQACENTPEILNKLFCLALEAPITDVQPIKDVDVFQQVPILSFSSDIETVYDEVISAKLHDNFQRIVKNKARIKHDSDEYNLNIESQIKRGKSQTCYIPFWIVTYRYHGELYKCGVDGFKGIYCGGDIPKKKEHESDDKKIRRNFFIGFGIFFVVLLYFAINSIIKGYGLDPQKIAYFLYFFIPTGTLLGYLTYKFLPQFWMVYDAKRRRQRELGEFLAEYNIAGVVELDVAPELNRENEEKEVYEIPDHTKEQSVPLKK